KIGRTQNDFVDRDHVKIDMVLCFSLIEMKLSQFLDLQNLAKRNEHAVLPQLSIAQRHFTGAGKRIRIGRLTACRKIAVELSLNRAGRPACLPNELVGIEAAKFNVEIEGRIRGLRLDAKVSIQVTAGGVCGNFREVQFGRRVTDRRL
ncbi:MAG: hypothetical protein QOG48_986, partial [Verrucomicrobiota bacterium]